jgi:hypothetical protein
MDNFDNINDKEKNWITVRVKTHIKEKIYNNININVIDNN